MVSGTTRPRLNGALEIVKVVDLCWHKLLFHHKNSFFFPALPRCLASFSWLSYWKYQSCLLMHCRLFNYTYWDWTRLQGSVMHWTIYGCVQWLPGVLLSEWHCQATGGEFKKSLNRAETLWEVCTYILLPLVRARLTHSIFISSADSRFIFSRYIKIIIYIYIYELIRGAVIIDYPIQEVQIYT